MRSGIYLWRNQTYIGRKAVAAAAGVNISTVDNHLAGYGHLENLGKTRAPNRNEPIEAGGHHFASASDLARKVGVHRATVRRWVREGRTDQILSAIERASEGHRGDHRGQPLSLDGRVWPTATAFARHVGVPPVTLRLWLRKGQTDRLRAALKSAEMTDRISRRAAA